MCVIGESDGIDGGRRHALFKLRSGPSVHQNLKRGIRIFQSLKTSGEIVSKQALREMTFVIS